MNNHTNLFDIENKARHLWGDYKLKAELANAETGLAHSLINKHPEEVIALWRDAVKNFKEAIQAREQAYDSYEHIDPPQNLSEIKQNP